MSRFEPLVLFLVLLAVFSNSWAAKDLRRHSAQSQRRIARALRTKRANRQAFHTPVSPVSRSSCTSLSKPSSTAANRCQSAAEKQPRSILKKRPQTTANQRSLLIADDSEELRFFKDTAIQRGLLWTSLCQFAMRQGVEWLLVCIRDAIPESPLARWLPVTFQPTKAPTTAGQLPDFQLPEYSKKEDAQQRRHIARLQRKNEMLQTRAILEEDDNLTNGFFSSHIGLHGPDPERWTVWNETLAMEKVPEVVELIRERERLQLLSKALSAWKRTIWRPR